MVEKFKEIKKQLEDFSDEHRAFFVCLILVPTDAGDVGGYREIREERSFLAGHGPKEHLLEILIERLKDVDDRCDLKRWKH